jgi:long-chain acyl-CoA synthetase
MYKTTADDISLSFLPLSHVFEHTWVYCQLLNGAQVNYCPDPKEIVDFLAEVKPTVMCSVPRIYEKIYSAVLSGVQNASPGKQKIFNWATSVGKQVYERKVLQNKGIGPWLGLKFKIADALALKKIRGIFGGRPKLFPSAGAPLAKEIEEFFWMGGAQICQGYGLTETSPTVTTNTPFNFEFGTVGRPLPDTILNFQMRAKFS